MRVWATIAIAMWLCACGPAPAPSTKTAADAPQAEAPSAPPVKPKEVSADGMDDLRGVVVARGTEPFWIFTAFPGKQFFISSPDDEGKSVAYRAPVKANGDVVMFASSDVTLALRKAACSDGMSDIAYPMEAVLTIGADAPRKGCAYPRWDYDLNGLIGAIDLCLDMHKKPGASGPTEAVVTYGVRDDQGALIRLAEGLDKRFDCRVRFDGSGEVKPVVDGENLLPGEREPKFFRAPAKNPGGACYEAAKATGPDGAFLGYLDGDDGC